MVNWLVYINQRTKQVEIIIIAEVIYVIVAMGYIKLIKATNGHLNHCSHYLIQPFLQYYLL